MTSHTLEIGPDVQGISGTPLFDEIAASMMVEQRAPDQRETIPYGIGLLGGTAMAESIAQPTDTDQVEAVADDPETRAVQVACVAGLMEVLPKIDNAITYGRVLQVVSAAEDVMLVPRITDQRLGSWNLWFKNPNDRELSGGMQSASDEARQRILGRAGTQVGTEAAALFGAA
jgi:hypothetical protein